jgi:hypothetical protein
MAAWSNCGLFKRIGYGAAENLHVLNIVLSPAQFYGQIGIR